MKTIWRLLPNTVRIHTVRLASRTAIFKKVKAAVEAYFGFATAQLKKNGTFDVAGMLNLKLVDNPATPTRKGAKSFTKKAGVLKPKHGSKTVSALPTKKFERMLTT